MNQFENLVNKNEYQVFVFYCPAYIPFDFFRHPWFVVNKKGEISRWEIKHIINKTDNSYLFINNQPPFEGIEKTFFMNKKWEANFLGFVYGDVAEKVIDYIENTKINYPYFNRYFSLGPNSNTYLQYVLSKFPEFNIKLSWRFIGRNFHV